MSQFPGRNRRKRTSTLAGAATCGFSQPTATHLTMLTRLALLACVVAPAAAFMPLSALPASARSAGAASPMRMTSNIWTPKSMNPRMMPEAPKPDAPARPIPMPMVSVGEGQMDIYSRLAKDRILLLGTDVNDEMANNLVAQMLFLANEDPGKDITMYSKCPPPTPPAPPPSASPPLPESPLNALTRSTATRPGRRPLPVVPTAHSLGM